MGNSERPSAGGELTQPKARQAFGAFGVDDDAMPRVTIFEDRDHQELLASGLQGVSAHVTRFKVILGLPASAHARLLSGPDVADQHAGEVV